MKGERLGNDALYPEKALEMELMEGELYKGASSVCE